MKQIPNFFIIGYPKAATTSLYYYLKDHPQIFMSHFKEPNFFSTDLRKESDNFHKGKAFFPIRSKDIYLSLFNRARKEKIIGEATPEYIFSKEAAKNIHSFNPKSKLLLVIREPISFLQSLHTAKVVHFHESINNLEKAMSVEPKRKKGKFLPNRVPVPSYLYYSEWVKYKKHIDRYLAYFPKKQIKFIIFDDLKNDPLETYKDVLKFLEVDYSPKYLRVSESKIYNTSHEVRFKGVYSQLKSPKLLKLLRPFIPKPFYGNIDKLVQTVFYVPREKPKIDEKFKSSLKRTLKPEVKKISDLLKHDLIKEWGYDKI